MYVQGSAHKVLVPGEPMRIMTKVGVSKTVSSTTQWCNLQDILHHEPVECTLSL